MVTIQSSIAMEWRQSSDMKASQILTLSFFISLFSSLGTHRADFFLQVKIFVESGIDRPGRHAIGLSMSSDGDTPVIGDLGGDISDESRITDSSFAVEDPLVAPLFPLLHFTNNLVQLRFLQGLVPVNLFTVSSIFLNGFLATARAPTKSRIGGMTYSGGGEENRVTGWPRGRPSPLPIRLAG
jgi:hypothetical protein